MYQSFSKQKLSIYLLYPFAFELFLVNMSVCLSVFLSVCLSVFLFVYLSLSSISSVH